MEFEPHDDITAEDMREADLVEGRKDTDGGDSNKLAERLLSDQSQFLEHWAFETADVGIVRKDMAEKIAEAVSILEDADAKPKSIGAFEEIMAGRLPILAQRGHDYADRKTDDLLYSEFSVPRAPDAEDDLLEPAPEELLAIEEANPPLISPSDTPRRIFETMNVPTETKPHAIKKEDGRKKKMPANMTEEDQKEEQEEDEHPVYKQLKKSARRAIKHWCKEHPEALQYLEDDHTVLAFAITGANLDARDHIVESRSAALDYIRHRKTKVKTKNIPQEMDTPELLNDVNKIIDDKSLPENVAKVLRYMCIYSVVAPERKEMVWPQQLRILLDSDESDRYSESDEGLPFMVTVEEVLRDTSLKIHAEKKFKSRKRSGKGQSRLVESYRLERREQSS